MSPFALRFHSLNRRRSQRLMLIAVFAFVTILSIGTLAMAARSDALDPWLAFRLIIGEFLIAWLAADQITGTLARARETYEWQDWRLIPGAAPEIVQGLVTSARSLLWTGIAIWAIVEIPMAASILRTSDQMVPVLLFLLAFHALLVAAVAHYAPTFIAAYARADGRMGRAWARCALHAFLVWWAISYLAVPVVEANIGTSSKGLLRPAILWAIASAIPIALRYLLMVFQSRKATAALTHHLESSPSP